MAISDLALIPLDFFYIRGKIEALLPRGFDHIERFAVAGGITTMSNDLSEDLDSFYDEGKWRGQPWYCYKSKKNETAADKSLVQALINLLMPSTPLEELQSLPWPEGTPRPYLRFK